MMKVFLGAFKPGADIANALAIYRKNGELLGSLPESGARNAHPEFQRTRGPTTVSTG